MTIQDLPSAASRYSRQQRVLIAAAVASIGRQWRRIDASDIATSFAIALPGMTAVTDLAQERIAVGAAQYVPEVLEETGQTRHLPAPDGETRPAGFVGIDGAGRPMDTLMFGAVVQARMSLANGLTERQALVRAGSWLSLAVSTALSDTGRAAETVGMATHHVGGYVRMLTPPSCSRCAILAGRWYRDSVAFQRHPHCDCRHIPASESIGDDMAVNATEYFDSLSGAEQDRIFTIDGAEAIRNGADPAQVVNARRGMSRAGQAYTTAGRRAIGRGVRMTPEGIRRAATSHDDYIRLLRDHGYVR